MKQRCNCSVFVFSFHIAFCLQIKKSEKMIAIYLLKRKEKKMTLCRKGGVSEKNQILNVLLKVTFYLGRGVDKNQCTFHHDKLGP